CPLAGPLWRYFPHDSPARQTVTTPDNVYQVHVHPPAREPSFAESVAHHLRKETERHHALHDDVREPKFPCLFHVVVVALAGGKAPTHLKGHLFRVPRYLFQHFALADIEPPVRAFFALFVYDNSFRVLAHPLRSYFHDSLA